jgi:hypothetical protein
MFPALEPDLKPIPGREHFNLSSRHSGRPFTILAVTPPSPTPLPQRWRLLSSTTSTSHFDNSGFSRGGRAGPIQVRRPPPGPGRWPPVWKLRGRRSRPRPPSPPVLIQDGQSWYEVERVVKYAWRIWIPTRRLATYDRDSAMSNVTYDHARTTSYVRRTTSC